MKHFLHSSLLIMFLSLGHNNYSQSCGNCDVQYSNSTSNNIHVSSGMVICIDQGVVCSGNVYMEGGTLCNHGTINQLLCAGGSGTVENFGIITNSDPFLDVSDNLVINSYSASTIDFSQGGNFDIVSTATVEFNLFNGSECTSDMGIGFQGGCVKINNGVVWSGASQYTADALFNVEDLSVNDAVLSISNTEYGIINVYGSINLNNEGDKYLNNSGIINIYNYLNIGGTSQNPCAITIENSGILTIEEDLIHNGTEMALDFQNTPVNAGDAATVDIAGDLLLSKSSATIQNSGTIEIGGSTNNWGGKIQNSGSFDIAQSFNNRDGTCINNLYFRAGELTNSVTAVFDNNKFLVVVGNFSNTGTTNLSEGSYMNLNNYYNGGEGAVRGPTSSVASIPRIGIGGYSENNTEISGSIVVYDRTLDCELGTEGFGFDVITNVTAIGVNVDFVSSCDDGDVVINCQQPDIGIEVNFPLEPICPSDSARTISAQLGYYLCAYGTQTLAFHPIAIATYTWHPGSHNSKTISVSPTVTTVYTITSTYQNCVYTKTIEIKVDDDCPLEIIGCCFSNYGVEVYVNKATTYLNVYCNLVNELGWSEGVLAGKFESKEAYVRVLLDWIHNAKNSLYYLGDTERGNTILFGGSQRMRGNSNTYFNNLFLYGHGTKSIWVNQFGEDNIDFSSNELDLKNFVFALTHTNCVISRTNGFAGNSTHGYLSHLLANGVHSIQYIYPMGATASSAAPFRYRPLVLENNSTIQTDEISVNFMNRAPALSTDPSFVHSNSALTNTVTRKAPNVLQTNNSFYHKIRHTYQSSAISDLIIRSYYVSSSNSNSDGNYQSLTEWKRDPKETHDWWGSTPGAHSSTVPSTDPETQGMVYAAINGTLDFKGEPFALAKGGFYINTSNFGNGNGTTMTVTSLSSGGGNTPTGGGLNQSFGTGNNGGNNGSGGSTVYSPSPVSGTYEIAVSAPNTCATGSRIKFVIDQNGNIDQQSIEYGVAGSTGYLGQLADEVYEIDQVNTGLTLKATPAQLLASCTSSIVIKSSTGNYFVVDKASETLNIDLPSPPPNNTITYGPLNIYNFNNQTVQSSALAAGPQSINVSALSAGVYWFEISVTASTAPPLTSKVKGQLIIK